MEDEKHTRTGKAEVPVSASDRKPSFRRPYRRPELRVFGAVHHLTQGLGSTAGDAGMSIHPHSEDMLAINGLLALMQQNWPEAVELLDELMEIQGSNTQAFTYVMMVRALRCNLDPARALQVARKGLVAYPDQLELLAESLALEDYADLVGESSLIQ